MRDISNVHLSACQRVTTSFTVSYLVLYFASKRDQVVFAKREDLNILDYNHLIVSLVKDGIIDNVFDVFLVPFGEEQHGLRITCGRIKNAFPVGVFTDAFEDGSDSLAHLLEPFGGLLAALFESLASSSTSIALAGYDLERQDTRHVSLGRLSPSKSMTGLGDLVNVPSST